MNKTKFNQIREILVNYKAQVNSIGKAYATQLEQYRQAYSTEFFQSRSQELKATEKSKLDGLRNTAKDKVNAIIKDLRRDLQDMVTDTSGSEVIQSLGTIKAAGLKLSLREIEGFLSKVNSNYLANKLLSQMAIENGYVVKVPDLADFERVLGQVEVGADTLLNCYVGSDLQAKELLPHNIRFGVDYGAYESYMVAMADVVLKQDGALDKAVSVWETNVKLTVSERNELTAEEKSHIESLYKGHEGAIADRTKELISINPKIKDELLLHEKYSEFVPTE
ncbi:MAG: hypothetical protein K0R31_1292 [Clostridiales bacterium]|jgi:hypothetical protein|nr:hypothetical protein [Clostridiales bacterium]